MKKLTVTLTTAVLMTACASGPKEVVLPLPENPPLTGIYEGEKDAAQWKRAYLQSGQKCEAAPARSDAVGAAGMAAGALDLLGPIGSLGGAIIGSSVDAARNSSKNKINDDDKLCWLFVFEDGTPAQYLVLYRTDAASAIKKTGIRNGEYTELPFVNGVMYRPW